MSRIDIDELIEKLKERIDGDVEYQIETFNRGGAWISFILLSRGIRIEEGRKTLKLLEKLKQLREKLALLEGQSRLLNFISILRMRSRLVIIEDGVKKRITTFL